MRKFLLCVFIFSIFLQCSFARQIDLIDPHDPTKQHLWSTTQPTTQPSDLSDLQYKMFQMQLEINGLELEIATLKLEILLHQMQHSRQHNYQRKNSLSI